MFTNEMEKIKRAISNSNPCDIVCENPQVCCGWGTLGLTNNQNPAAARVSLGLTNSKYFKSIPQVS